ncbi:DUF421 domain-containing protein [Sphingomonas sp.]|jgi:uncharacterized membrane protein YcaP (DUF421 family)|uniref:DUF421 domain-containing protein n=1 Tax=Sphingomonas sp. TaxID=28214 RepID=UPI002E36BAC4|nr:YetF domain-containing protein [Sphingomonas sp.]HEX4693450.1 YetF domain-containing protein [Sphingomonas sp.]
MEWLQVIVGPDNGTPSVAQFCARAVILFLYGILCIRIAGRRTFSNLSPLDIIVAIVVGSNISRAMTGKAPFVATIVATLLLVVLHRLVARATVHANWLGRLVKGKPVTLVRDGQIDRVAMRRQDISDEDLLEGLRLKRAEHPSDVRLATFERGGKISVVPK